MAIVGVNKMHIKIGFKNYFCICKVLIKVEESASSKSQFHIFFKCLSMRAKYLGFGKKHFNENVWTFLPIVYSYFSNFEQKNFLELNEDRGMVIYFL